MIPPPALPAPGRFASELVAFQGPLGAPPYDDPASMLGMPATDFFDPWGGWSGGTTTRRVKLVEPAYHLDPTQTRKLIATLQEGSFIIVRFDEPVEDHPAHPYGVDFLVFGNAFFAANGMVTDSTDMNTLGLVGGGFYEPMKVSVSPGYTGKLGQLPDAPATWDWYRYENGPYADTAFPTHAYHWNRADSTWTDELMDFTKPVNPAVGPLIEAGGPFSAADAIDLYDGAGGGTGFDLAESGFAFIRYVKVEGLPGFAGGEVDAVSAVRPAVMGDSLIVAPGNLTNGSATLWFQQPDRPAEPALTLSFTAVSPALRVVTEAAPDTAVLAPYGRVLTAGGFACAPVPGGDVMIFRADARLATGADYEGDGGDLTALRQLETSWGGVPFQFDSGSRSVVLPGLTQAATLALIQISSPTIAVSEALDASGNPVVTVSCAGLPGWTYTLERTSDFGAWSAVASQTPEATGGLVFTDSAGAGRAFYRIRLNRP